MAFTSDRSTARGAGKRRNAPDLRKRAGFCDFAGMNDDGSTLLPGGKHVSKSNHLVCALGSLEELNAALGLLRAALPGKPDAARIESWQKQVLVIGGELATGRPALGAEAVAALEQEIAARTAGQPPRHGFVLPGADEVSARAHWARAVCRRAERDLIRAQEAWPERVFPPARAWLNRLSHLLFALGQ